MIQDLLLEWARWHREGSGNIGFPSRTAFDRLRGSSVPTPNITDDVAMIVDGAVSRLRLRNPDQALVLTEYYLKGKSLGVIARKARSSRQTMAMTLRRAETAIEWIVLLT